MKFNQSDKEDVRSKSLLAGVSPDSIYALVGYNPETFEPLRAHKKIYMESMRIDTDSHARVSIIIN